MRIKTRVNLAIVGVAAFSAFAVGGTVLAVSYNSGVNQVQQSLKQAVHVVEKSSEDAVTTALVAVDGREITLAFVEVDGTVTTLQDAAGELSDANLQKQTLKLPDGEKLIFAASTKTVIDSTLGSLLLTLILATLVAIIGFLISWFVLKNDVKNIKTLTLDAEKIATGDLANLNTLKGSSELVELSASLSALVRKLQNSKAQMQEFLGDASHELRTPLTVIRGYLEMLQSSPEVSKDQSQKAIERAHQESLRMQAIIANILLLAELGEEKAPQLTSINFERLFQNALDDLKTQNPNRSVEVTTNQHSDFTGDAELLERFFLNAMSNIKRYTPDNAQVLVQVMQSPVGFDILIDDAGPGIDSLSEGAEISVFKRFDESRSRGTGGSGLGLSIMAKIIEKHGGEMRLSRSSLGGLRVSAFLPN